MAGHVAGFSSAWLALRAPFDTQCRDVELARAFAAALPSPALVVDLGAGAGANVRYLSPIVGHDVLSPIVGPGVRFRLVDNDANLLALAQSGLSASTQIEVTQGNLDRDLQAAVAGADAVTAAALMDLVSAAWFDGFAELAARRSWPLLFALSVDGRCLISPADRDDEGILAGFARDQQRDKGFGPALGPRAPAYMRDRLVSLGARVRLAPSDWRIDAQAPEMLEIFLDGVAEAASRDRADDAPVIAAWLARRREQIAAGALSLVVGHQDLLAVW